MANNSLYYQYFSTINHKSRGLALMASQWHLPGVENKTFSLCH